MNSAATADETLFSFFAKRAFAQMQNQTLSSANAAEFISFEERQKKRTKEKCLPRQSNPIAELLSGFFDSPSWLGRKTAHVPVQRPTGLARTTATH
jgi:hypothetical protein